MNGYWTNLQSGHGLLMTLMVTLLGSATVHLHLRTMAMADMEDTELESAPGPGPPPPSSSSPHGRHGPR